MDTERKTEKREVPMNPMGWANAFRVQADHDREMAEIEAAAYAAVFRKKEK